MVVYGCSNPDCSWSGKIMGREVKVCPNCGKKLSPKKPTKK